MELNKKDAHVHDCCSRTNCRAPSLPSGSPVKLFPPEEALQGMTDDQLRTLRRFSVEHREHGVVVWEGYINVLDIGNVEDVVSFQVPSSALLSGSVPHVLTSATARITAQPPERSAGG
jgi:hypothetical protein